MSPAREFIRKQDKHLDDLIRNQHLTLETATDPIQIQRIQGRIAAYRYLRSDEYTKFFIEPTKQTEEEED